MGTGGEMRAAIRGRFVVTIVLAIVSMARVVGASDSIGLYFDEHGLSACDTSIAEYPRAVDAFLIAKDLADPCGLSGWECALSLDPAIHFSGYTLYGDNPLNIDQPPEFVVGLRSPVAGSDGVTCLGRLSLIAVGPGRIYLHGVSNPSIPGSDCPVFVGGCNPAVILPWSYEYGSPNSAVAAVGNECPTMNESMVAPSMSTLVLEDRDPIKPAAPVQIVEHFTPDTSYTAADALHFGLFDQDVCLLGELLSYEARCDTALKGYVPGVSGGIGRRLSSVIAAFRVLKSYWQVDEGDQCIVLLEDISNPECTLYSSRPLPYARLSLEDLSAGQHYLIGAKFNGSVLAAYTWTVVPVDGARTTPSSDFPADPLEIADSLSERVAADTLVSRSDAIIIGRVERLLPGGVGWEVDVERLIAGAVSDEQVPVYRHKDWGDWEDWREDWPGFPLALGKVYLFLLEQRKDGYVPVEGRWGVYSVDGPGLFTLSGFDDRSMKRALLARD
jgi:hypothetical protein